MLIEKDKVVILYYILIDVDNDLILEKSSVDVLMVYLYGVGNIFVGLEQVLEGKDSGDCFIVFLDLEQVYGCCDELLCQCLFVKYFKYVGKLKFGKIVWVQIEQGLCMVMVFKVGLKIVDVDVNYLFVGCFLCFELEVIDVCDVDVDEKVYGYVYGLGGYVY